jgi:dienelactone hydrolase
VGGIVSEPEGEPRAPLLLLQGVGRPARSGVNSFWTRLAREFSARGLVVLRYDCSREGENFQIGEGGGGQTGRRDIELRLLSQIVPWFRERAGGADLLLAGACTGGRLAIELAGSQPGAVAGAFLIVPYLRTAAPSGSPPGRETIDPLVVSSFRTALERGPSWIVIGEHDTPDIPRLKRLLGPAAAGLEVEVVPGVALHLLDRSDLQEQARSRLTARIARALTERQPVRA